MLLYWYVLCSILVSSTFTNLQTDTLFYGIQNLSVNEFCLNWYYRNSLSFILYPHVSSLSRKTADALDYPWVCVHHVRLTDSRCFINALLERTWRCQWSKRWSSQTWKTQRQQAGISAGYTCSLNFTAFRCLRTSMETTSSFMIKLSKNIWHDFAYTVSKRSNYV